MYFTNSQWLPRPSKDRSSKPLTQEELCDHIDKREHLSAFISYYVLKHLFNCQLILYLLSLMFLVLITKNIIEAFQFCYQDDF